MKKKLLLPLVTLVLLFLIGCGSSVTQESPSVTPTKEPTATVAPVITEAPEPTKEAENVIEPTKEPVPTESLAPEQEPTSAPTTVPEPTAEPEPTATLSPTATPIPTATPKPTTPPVPQDVACTYNFKDMKYYTSYGMAYTINSDGSIDTKFEGQYQEIMLKLPMPVDMKYCSKIVVKAKSETAHITIKFYGADRFTESTTSELFAEWHCYGNGIAEYKITPPANGNVAGIGIMATNDDKNFSATVYSVTFYVKEEYAEKLMAPPATPTPTPSPTPEPTKALSRAALTGLDAEEIVDKIVIGWNLGNTLESESETLNYNSTPAQCATAWGNEQPTLEVFEAVKAAGFNAVRIPVTWYQQMKYDAATDTYVIKQEWLDYVKKTVDYAYYLDLFVILNTHHEEWIETPEFTNATYATASKMMEDLWAQVAEIFKDYDQGLIFEGMNEPRRVGAADEWTAGTPNDWEYLNKLNKIFVNTVRSQGSSANKERLLMLTEFTASATAYDAIRALEIPANAGNVAISVHAYAPYHFCMTGDNPANFNFPGSSQWGENYEATLDDLFANLKQLSKEKNVPFILGEYGSSDNNNPEDRARWATHYLTLAKDAGIPCFIWDNQGRENYPAGDRYGLLHRKSATWHESCIPMLQAMMKVYGQSASLPKYAEPKRTGFSWNNIPIEKDWVELYRSDSGEKLEAWAPVWINNWKPYLNDNYEIVVVYDSGAQPTLVLQGGWHHIRSTGYSSNAYMLPFSMEDVRTTLSTEHIKLEDMTGFFTSAGSQAMTLYGLYAVPVK